MQRFLGIDNIVEVKSVGVGEKFSISRLNTLAIVKFDPSNPQPQLKYFTNSKDIFTRYGSSKETDFAKTYFGFTSKIVTSPELLGFYIWNKEAIGAYLLGDRSPSMEELKKLNGKFLITINGTEKDIELDLTGEGILSYDNVAGAIQTALRKDGDGGFANATCIYSPIRNGFIIGSGTTGKDSSIEPITSPSEGTDISGSLGLTASDAVELVEGKEGIATLEGMLNDISSINGNYYVITPLFKFEEEAIDLKTFGSWLKAQKDRYLGIYLWDNKQLGISGSGATEPLLAYDGLYIDWKKTDTQNAFSSAIISSMDLSKQNGTYNINFNVAEEYKAQAVSVQSEFDGMNENRANTFYIFGELGQSTTAYGRGQVMGYTSSVNVYVANSFLKIQMQFAIAQLFVSIGMIPLRGGAGFSLVKSALSPILQNAVDNRLIIIDELTPLEKNVVTQNFKDGEEAVTSLERSGWYLEVGDINNARKEITLNFAYIANMPANRVVIKNYILGV